MEEPICSVEFLRDDVEFLAKIQSDLGGLREFRSPSIEEVLEQVLMELREEFESYA